MRNMASSGNGFCSAILFFFIGLAMIYTGVKRFLLVQKIKDTPTSKAEAAAVGLVELFGKARCIDAKTQAALVPEIKKELAAMPGMKKISLFRTSALETADSELESEKEFVSPISKVRCAYWRVLGQYYQSGKHGGWRNIYDDRSYAPFYCEDETGKVLIDPNGAEVDIPSDRLFEGYITGTGVFGASHTKLDPQALDFINGLDEAGKKAFMNHEHEDVRVYEYYIAEEDELYVLGSAEPREGVASDVGSENLIVRKGDIDKTMYISDSGERRIIQKMSGSMYWQIFGGLAVSAVCLFIILGVYLKM
jgi:hypothetical protein